MPGGDFIYLGYNENTHEWYKMTGYRQWEPISLGPSYLGVAAAGAVYPGP